MKSEKGPVDRSGEVVIAEIPASARLLRGEESLRLVLTTRRLIVAHRGKRGAGALAASSLLGDVSGRLESMVKGGGGSLRLFSAGNLANLLSGIAFAELAFIMALYFQLVRGYDPQTTELELIPLEAALLLVGPVSGWLSDRWGARGLSTLGLVITSLGLLLPSGLNQTTPDVHVMLWLAIIGLGIGLFRSPNASSVMGSVPAEKRGISAGIRATIINTSIVASIPLAVAVMTAAIHYEKLVNIIGEKRLSSSGDAYLLLAGIQHALLVFAVVTLASAVFSILRGPRNSNNRLG